MRKSLLKLIVLLFIGGTGAYAQTTVTGRITSAADGAGVPGASVLVKGTTNGTTANVDGKFSITLNDPANSVLVFSFIGYATQEIAVQNQSSINVTLQEDFKELNEVVVTALGVAREQKTLVYSAQTVKPTQLTEVQDPNNVLNSLTGKVANINITQGSGGPGSGLRVVLRGNRSISNNNNALIVVDGVPITNGLLATNNGTQQNSAGNDFGSVQNSDGASNINPDDIESMTVLRGASAAALYGSQAGNGVILITTKKGNTGGGVSVNINSGITFDKAFALPKFQNSYGQGINGALDATQGASWGAKMDGQSYTNHLGEQRTYSAQPDNVKDFFRTGVALNNSIGIMTGTDKAQTYLSYTNNSVQGIVPKNDLMRHTFNLRMSNQISKKLSSDAKITYINQQIDNRPRTGEENAPVIDIYQIPRNVSLNDAKQYEVYDAANVPLPAAWPSTASSIYQNPYWMINRTAINEHRDRFMGFVSLKYDITDWLSIQGRGNLDRYIDKGEQIYSHKTLLWAQQQGGYYQTSNTVITQKWFDVILSGNNKLSDDLKLDYRAGAIMQRIDNTVDYNIADGLNVTNKFALAYATNPAFANAALIPYYVSQETHSVFGQANLGYKEVLFLEATIRNDWDSRLATPYTITYPSVGLSGIISDMTTLPSAISFLKLSSSYAVVGNGGVPQSRFNFYTYTTGAGGGLMFQNKTLALPGLKPELVKNLEFTVDARFLNDRLGLNLTYYKSNSTNQLLAVPMPPASGYQSKYINAGNIQNTGIEGVLTASPVRNPGGLIWDVAFNFGINRNKVIKLSDDVKTMYLTGGNSFGRSATPQVTEGGRFGDLIGYKWMRDANGNFVVKNTGDEDDGTPVQSTSQEYLGNVMPKATLGLTNTFEYKRFTLRILADGRLGGVIVSGTEMNLAASGITEETAKYREGGLDLHGVDSEGNAVNKTTDAQHFWKAASGQRYGVAEFFAYNATNFRVRELSVGYNIPLPADFPLKTMRFSFVARNLFWLYRGESLLDIPGLGKRKMQFDPEMALGNGNYQGIQYATLPSTRSIGFNLKLGF